MENIDLKYFTPNTEDPTSVGLEQFTLTPTAEAILACTEQLIGVMDKLNRFPFEAETEPVNFNRLFNLVLQYHLSKNEPEFTFDNLAPILYTFASLKLLPIVIYLLYQKNILQMNLNEYKNDLYTLE